MKYKLLVLDLDGTLLDDEINISEKNIKALQEVERKNIAIVLCSGRPFVAMKNFVEELNIHAKEDYVISFNGAMITTIEGERIYYNPIEEDALKELIQLGRDYHIDVQLYTEDLLIERYTEKTSEYEKASGMKAVLLEDLKTIKKSVKVLFNGEVGEKLERLRKELIVRFGDIFNIFYSKPTFIEVLAKEVDKGFGVKFVADRLGIQAEEIIAVGDGFNDVAMLTYAGMGIAVQNAPEGVKKVANHITKNTNNEDAIAEVIKDFLGNN